MKSKVATLALALWALAVHAAVPVRFGPVPPPSPRFVESPRKYGASINPVTQTSNVTNWMRATAVSQYDYIMGLHNYGLTSVANNLFPFSLLMVQGQPGNGSGLTNLAGFLMLTSFGGDATGRTPSDAAMSNAIAAAASTGRGLAVTGSNVFLAPIIATNSVNLWLCGQGDARLVYIGSSNISSFITVTNSAPTGLEGPKVENLTIQGSGNVSNLITLGSCYHDSLRNIRLLNCYGIGAALIGCANCGLLENVSCSANDLPPTGFTTKPTAGIMLANCTCQTILNPIIEGVSGIGIYVTNGYVIHVVGGSSGSNRGGVLDIGGNEDRYDSVDFEANAGSYDIFATNNNYLIVHGGVVTKGLCLGNCFESLIDKTTGGGLGSLLVDVNCQQTTLAGLGAFAGLTDFGKNTDYLNVYGAGSGYVDKLNSLVVSNLAGQAVNLTSTPAVSQPFFIGGSAYDGTTDPGGIAMQLSHNAANNRQLGLFDAADYNGFRFLMGNNNAGSYFDSWTLGAGETPMTLQAAGQPLTVGGTLTASNQPYVLLAGTAMDGTGAAAGMQLGMAHNSAGNRQLFAFDSATGAGLLIIPSIYDVVVNAWLTNGQAFLPLYLQTGGQPTYVGGSLSVAAGYQFSGSAVGLTNINLSTATGGLPSGTLGTNLLITSGITDTGYVSGSYTMLKAGNYFCSNGTSGSIQWNTNGGIFASNGATAQTITFTNGGGLLTSNLSAAALYSSILSIASGGLVSTTNTMEMNTNTATTAFAIYTNATTLLGTNGATNITINGRTGAITNAGPIAVGGNLVVSGNLQVGGSATAVSADSSGNLWAGQAWVTNGNLTITNGVFIVQQTNSAALLGANLAPAAGNFTYDSTWTESAGPTFVAIPAATPLVCNATISSSAYYQISFTLSAVTAGNVTVSVGTFTSGPYTSAGTYIVGSRAGSASALTFTPKSTFNGALSAISIQVISPGPAQVVLQDTNGNNAWELRGNLTLGNSFQGVGDGSYNTLGSYNTANGVRALFSNTVGSCNTANGYGSLYSNAIGGDNTANGYYSLYSNTSGNYNTANGFRALFSNTVGSYNTANGYGSLLANTNNDNTADGYGTLLYSTNLMQCTAAGANAGSLSAATAIYAATNLTLIGYGAGADPSVATTTYLTNSTAIGANSTITANNQVSLGSASVTAVVTAGALWPTGGVNVPYGSSYVGLNLTTNADGTASASLLAATNAAAAMTNGTPLGALAINNGAALTNFLVGKSQTMFLNQNYSSGYFICAQGTDSSSAASGASYYAPATKVYANWNVTFHNPIGAGTNISLYPCTNGVACSNVVLNANNSTGGTPLYSTTPINVMSNTPFCFVIYANYNGTISTQPRISWTEQ